MNSLFVAGRREIKYVLEQDQLKALDKALRPVLELDLNNQNDQGYFNYSIYFDSPSFRFWHEKIEGLSVRVKPRLRVYKSKIDSAPSVYFLELKHRHGHFISKERTRVSKEIAQALIEGEDITAAQLEFSDILKKFHYLKRRHNLMAVVCVMYHRFAYAIPIQHRLRITYDTHLQCSRVIGFDTLPEVFSYVEPPGRSIIELKYDKIVPHWINNLCERLQLQQVSYSKYSESMSRAHSVWM